MSWGDTGGSGRYEPAKRLVGGPGQMISARCDECQVVNHAHRKRAKVLQGPLRGLQGMVCHGCLAKRRAG